MTTTTATIINVTSPVDGQTIGSVPTTSRSELNTLVEQAQAAFAIWGQKTHRERSQVFYNYRQLLIQNMDRLAQLIHQENGKTIGESKAEIAKAIEITEFACSLPQFFTDEGEMVSGGIYCQQKHYPLGVVSSITPSNFPSMVPHWTIPIALVAGNTMILKPSEIVPLSAIEIQKLLTEAGLPEHVFQVAQGGRELVEEICDHPTIQAISFVGSTAIASQVYQRATASLKRCIALGGAKNHIILLPDAHVEMSARDIAASMTGCAGQRCMAASVLVAVGDCEKIIQELVTEAQKIVPGDCLGAITSPQGKARIESYISQAESDGATCLLDGRGIVVPGKENGSYVGPTIIDHVDPNMSVAKEEIFGPVLSIIRVNTVEEAIAIQNSSDYGNGAAVFTQNGPLSAKIANALDAGMVGINIGVPVPREPFSFGGWNASKFGTEDITGKSSLQFWTKLKKVTTKWNPEDKRDWMS